MKKTVVLALVCIVAVFACTAAFAWEPARDVELIVPSAPGGGSDLNARTIADIVQSEKLAPATLMVVNKPGGSGAVSFSYVGSKKGNNETLMILHSGQDFGSYVNNWDIKAKDLTYIATVAFDDLLICAPAGKFTDMKDAIEKSKTTRITYGGSQKGNGDHLSFLMTNKYTGANFNYVMFNSAGEVTSAILGGHVDIGVYNPSECVGQIEAGNLVPLATFSTKRIGGAFKDVPTFTELGFKELVLTETRAISAAPDMSPDAVAFYVEMLRKVTETAKWKDDYIAKKYLTPVFMNSEDSRKFFIGEADKAMAIFKEVGFVK